MRRYNSGLYRRDLRVIKFAMNKQIECSFTNVYA